MERLAGLCGDERGRQLLIGALLGALPRADRPQLVWTAPGAPLGARGTLGVLMDLLTAATTNVVIVGYSITAGVKPIIGTLADAGRRGVRITIVADRLEEQLTPIVKNWPADVPLPDFWTRPAQADTRSSLHAKLVIVDDSWLLLTSANLTVHGLHGNIEMGILEHGAIAREASELIDLWVRSGLVTRLR